MTNNAQRGRAGEALAAAYLEMRGCTLVARNERYGGVEVDLVVDEGATRVLVEVRMRSRDDYGGAAATVNPRKQHRLLRAASAMLQLGHSRLRIDVVALDLADDGLRLTHHRNAVAP